MDEFLRMRYRLPAADEDDLPEILAGLPVLGSEITATNEQTIEVDIYLPDQHREASTLVADCLHRAGAVALETSRVALQDWLAVYRSRATPFPVGRMWWLDPHPEHPTPAPEQRVRLAVEPRMAFGTGSHESTQLILLELEELAVAQRSVLDVGTGSGILALAADALGAALVVGLDVDPLAVWVARQNLAVQDWPARPRFIAGPIRSIGDYRFELVLCNMIPEHFRPLLGDLRRTLDDNGEVILSGILSSQYEAVKADLLAARLQVTGERRCNEWLCLRATSLPWPRPWCPSPRQRKSLPGA
jgi:ribosomal protein L11 methyltransferase